MANRIQHRRDTAANWTSINPVLAAGEIGMETDTGNTKLGDGVTAWASLGYQAPNATALAATYASKATTVAAGTGLTGGGDLSANRTFAVAYGTTAGTAAQGNDARILGSAQVANNLSDLLSATAARANLGLGDAATHPASDFLATTSKGAANGVAGLDAGGNVAQYPRLHAATHGNGGTDPLFAPVNAKLDFGAKGDGSTDDTTALQNFVTYCINNNRLGFIPAGTYKITAAINFTYKPGFVISGAGKYSTTIKQFTDNTAIFILGSDTASQMHSMAIINLGFDYNNIQTGNTNANPILFSQMVYESTFNELVFNGGYYAMRVANGIGGPWGCTFDNITFGGNLTGGAMDWSQCVNSVPNNRFGRIFCSCQSMTQTVFSIRGYAFTIDTIEFITATNGVRLIDMAAGSRVTIGALKLENGTYNANQTLFNFPAGCAAIIGHINVSGDTAPSPTLIIGTGATVYVIGTATAPGNGFVRVGFMDVGSTTLSGQFYIANATSQVVIDNYKNGGNLTGLQNNGSSASANTMTVSMHVNNQISDDKGNADYSVTLGDPNIVQFRTALTAAHVVNLPNSNNFNFSGLYYEIISYGAVNGTNTLTIKAGSTTICTISADKTKARVAWQRSTGWVVTAYGTLP